MKKHSTQRNVYRRAENRAPKAPPAGAKDAHSRSLVYLAVCAVAVALCLLASALLLRDNGTAGPEQPDVGESAGAWAKNDRGYYFSSSGEVITAATKKGIDVSEHQGEIDWQKAKDAGIDFAILRCGYGSEWNGEGEYNQDDAYWRANYEACQNLGIPYGIYLYSYALTEEQARSEADHVARLMGLMAPAYEELDDYTANPCKLTYPVYYDLEDPKITSLYPDEMARIVSAFFDQLQKRGYNGEQGLYASINWVRSRFDDPAFDRWRNNLWIARYNTELGYTGTYSMWQCTYQEPGETYGVQSETVDVDFVMEELVVTGITDGKGKTSAPGFSNDTYQCELWLAEKGDRATLTTNEPAEDAGGQKLYYTTSDKAVATVDKNGVVKARGTGQCTITVTLADGTQSAECLVRVGKVTVPVFATAGLHGDVTGMEHVAALKADTPDAILVDAGGSLQGTVRASLTGGMDICSMFSACGYDLQVFDASDLAYGVERLRSDENMASGPALAANLISAETGLPVLDRATCWNRNRISNGMNAVVEQAGKKIGFFALCGTGNVTGAAGVTASDAAETAAAQVAALQARGVDAIVCITGADTDPAPLLDTLKELGVTAVIAGNGQTSGQNGKLTVVGAGAANGSVGKLELTFGTDGSVTAAAGQVDGAALAGTTFGDEGETARSNAAAKEAELARDDEEILPQKLFDMEWPDKVEDTITFGNYVAELYLSLYTADRDALPGEYSNMYPSALTVAVSSPAYGDTEISRGDLMNALPGGARIQLVLTDGASYAELLANETVSETYRESLKEKDVADGPILLVTDTASLATLSNQNYTVVRDYGDAFWCVRMAINDATNGFTGTFALPDAE